MCGICGIVDYNKKIDENIIRMMAQELRHRGPDDEGIMINSLSNYSLGFGHRRLSIIDLSPRGHQPMSNEDKTIWITFNGEIYNFLELKSILEQKGHQFQSDTDTEVILHLYEEHRENCLKYLRGMFAFAIWDKKEDLLFLARDRIGKKPLLYYHRKGVFCFASEFKALLASNMITKEIKLESINHYLSLGYIPAPLTIYQDIFKLPPAHYLILKNNQIGIYKYWELDYAQKVRISQEEAEKELLKYLREAVRIRLVSDVPLGAFLSGGIDSSAIVALMSEVSRVKTFSIGFQEQDFSELEYARDIAKKFSTDHSEFIVKPDALKILPLLVERYGEPYADSSCIPTYYVSQQTRQYVTVALNGDGGDESFAGYERYPAMMAIEIVPQIFTKMAVRISKFFPEPISSRTKLGKLKRFLNGADLPFQKRYLRWVGIFDDNFKNLIYAKSFTEKIRYLDSLDFLSLFLNQYKKANILDALLSTDVNSYLPFDLLVKVDIASMANSLEARSPFLDQELMEFAAKLPAEYKIHHFIKKYLLKEAMEDYLPKKNIYRKKMGFGLPTGNWFKEELRDFLSCTLLSRQALKRGYFKQDAIKNLIQEHVREKKDHTFHLWALLMLELWHQRFID